MKKTHGLAEQIAAFTLTRMVMNTGYRMVYPFLPIFAAGLGIDLTTISLAVSARSLIGLVGPLLAPIADRRGRKVSMALGLAIFICGALSVTVWHTFWAFFAALSLTIIGITIFLPAMQAYLGDHVAYEKRGTALAITEISWSLGFVVGVPVASLAIDRWGWAAPFPLIAGFALLGLLAILWIIPNRRPSQTTQVSALQNFKQIFTSPLILLALGVGLSIVAANEMVNLVFGVWIERSFGLQITALGAASAVIGFSELSGEGLSAWLVDRLGKERSVALGIGFSIVTSLFLPLIGKSLTGAMVGLFLFYLPFEFTMVGLLPFMTELMPAARATLMAMAVALFTQGRTLGALIAPRIFNGDILTNCLASIGFNLVALACLWGTVRLMKKEHTSQAK